MALVQVVGVVAVKEEVDLLVPLEEMQLMEEVEM